MGTEIIEYDYFVSRIGHGLIAGSASGICDVAFTDAQHAELFCELELQNPGRKLIHAPGRFADVCRHMFSSDVSACELVFAGFGISA